MVRLSLNFAMTVDIRAGGPEQRYILQKGLFA